MEKNKRDLWIIYSLMIILPLVIFWQACSFSFVWDDARIHLTENPLLRRINIENIQEIWERPYEGLYIPVSYTLWGLMKPLGQAISTEKILFNPFVYHLANLIIHILNGLLLYYLLSYFVKKRWAVCAGVLVFMLHPIQVEAVVWISEFRGLLAIFFGLSSLHCFLLSERRDFKFKKSVFFTIASVTLFVLSTLSKPSTVVIPLIAILFDRIIFKTDLKKIMIKLSPCFVFTIFILIITKSSQSEPGLGLQIPLWERPLIWMDALNNYLYKIIIPFPLCASYARVPGFLASQWWFYVAWIFPVILACLCWKERQKHPQFGVSLLVFIIGFLPVSGLIVFSFQKWSTVADRYLYLSMVGTALAVAYTIEIFGKSVFLRVLAMGIILFYCSWDFFFQIPVWKNPITLWSHCIKTNPMEAKAYVNRGNSFKEKKQFALAMSDYDKAMKLTPKDPDIYNNRGLIFLHGYRDSHKAIKEYEKAIVINPNDHSSYNNRGQAYASLGNHGLALKDFTRAIELKPDYSDAYINRGNTYCALTEYEKALDDYNKSIEKGKESAMAYFNRGNLYRSLNNPEQALKDYSIALELNPTYTEVYLNKGLLYLSLKKFEEAILNLTNAINLSPKRAEAYNNRARAFQFMNKHKLALQDFNKAINLKPDYAEVFYNRGNLQCTLNAFEKAAKDFSEAIINKPDFAAALFNRAYAYGRLKRLKEAAKDLERLKSLKHGIDPSKIQAMEESLQFYLKK